RSSFRASATSAWRKAGNTSSTSAAYLASITCHWRGIQSYERPGTPCAERGNRPMNDLIWSDAVEQAGAIRAGQISAMELLDAYLDRIDAFNSVLRAFVTVDRDGARAAAADVDSRRRADPAFSPPFAGIPISIKDTDDVAGLPTTHSCSLLA